MFGAYQTLRRQPAFLIEGALLAFQIPFTRAESQVHGSCTWFAMAGPLL